MISARYKEFISTNENRMHNESAARCGLWRIASSKEWVPPLENIGRGLELMPVRTTPYVGRYRSG